MARLQTLRLDQSQKHFPGKQEAWNEGTHQIQDPQALRETQYEVSEIHLSEDSPADSHLHPGWKSRVGILLLEKGLQYPE